MGIGAAIAGSVIGGVVQSRAAGKAADAQTQAAAADRELQRELYYQTRTDLAPYRGYGENALRFLEYDMGMTDVAPMMGGTPLEVTRVGVGESGNALANLFPNAQGTIFGNAINQAGGGGTGYRWQAGDQMFDTEEEARAYAAANPTGGTAYGGFQGSPGFQFAMQQGQDSIDASAAARGMLRSGGTMQAQQEFGTGLAQQDYANHIARLMGAAGIGTQAAAQQVAANQNYGNAASQTYAATGNALAAGAIGQGNAIAGMMNNLGGIWGYQQANGGWGQNRNNTGNWFN